MEDNIYKLNAINSNVLSEELLNYLLEQFPLGNSIIHGRGHWLRVLYNGRLLAKETKANLNVVELFAVIHDCKRDNEHFDLKHGRRAAEYVYQIQGKFFNINNTELEMLVEACKYHSDGLTKGNPTIQTCWDSDRLDLGRVGIKPTANKLCTEVAKREDILNAAYLRSIDKH